MSQKSNVTFTRAAIDDLKDIPTSDARRSILAEISGLDILSGSVNETSDTSGFVDADRTYRWQRLHENEDYVVIYRRLTKLEAAQQGFDSVSPPITILRMLSNESLVHSLPKGYHLDAKD